MWDESVTRDEIEDICCSLTCRASKIQSDGLFLSGEETIDAFGAEAIPNQPEEVSAREVNIKIYFVSRFLFQAVPINCDA